MKNLKKVLSLALAFAMVLGLCIGASAAQDVTTLTDWNEVENKDAATLLNAFNIMQGNDDGTFAPNDNVTRAQAAKMLSVALWGGNDDVALYSANNVGGYTDVVAGSWYMGYVNYMTVQSIVTGKGEGIFDPNGTVTGYELLKMCLVSLGYSPETEGMTGAGWDVRTMALATRPGFANLTANTSVTNWNAPLTRTNAAQIIANMINRTTVSYSLTSGVGGNVTSMVVPNLDDDKNEITFGVSYLKMDEVKGVLVANEYGSIGTVAALEENEKGNAKMAIVSDGDDNGNVVTITIASDFADLGLPVKAYKSGNAILYAATANVTKVEPTVSAAGVVTNVAETYSLIKNGAAATPVTKTAADTDAGTPEVTVGAKLAAELVPNAEVACYSLNAASKGKIDTVIVNTVTPTKVTGVAESEKYGTVILTGNAAWNESRDSKAEMGKLNGKLINCDFTAEKGDYVALSTTRTNVNGENTTHGYVMDVVEGKVTRASAANDQNVSTTIYIDGVKYSNTIANNLQSGAINIASEGSFYLYADGKTVGAFEGVTVATADKYALIYDVGYEGVTGTGVGATSSFTAQVAAVLPDATDKVFTIKSFVAAGSAAAPTKDSFDTTFASFYTGTTKNANVVSLMKYTLNSDGTINLYTDQTASSAIGAEVKITKGNAITTGGSLMGKDTVTFVQTSEESATTTEKWAVYTGTSIESVTIAATAIAVADGKTFADNDTYSYIVAKKTEADFGTTTTDVYVTVGAPYMSIKTDGTGCKEVQLYQTSTGKLITTQFDTADTTIKANTFYASVGIDGKPAGEGIVVANSKVGYITNFENNTIRVATYVDDDAQDAEEGDLKEGTANIFVVNDKTTYHLINGEESKTITAADVEAQLNHTKDKYEVVVVTDKVVANANTAQQVFIFSTAVTGTAPSVGAAAQGGGR